MRWEHGVEGRGKVGRCWGKGVGQGVLPPRKV